MPKASRLRNSVHFASVKTSNLKNYGKDLQTDTSSVDWTKTENVASDETLPTVEATNDQPDIPLHISKKEKRKEKHDAFLQKFGVGNAVSSKSKSHLRRLKRKEKEQLAGRITDLQDALASVDTDQPAIDVTPSDKGPSTEVKKTASQAGKIGTGKTSTLSSSERRRALELERLRHPLILANPDYGSNPFQTIRTHAQNTLLKHVPQA